MLSLGTTAWEVTPRESAVAKEVTAIDVAHQSMALVWEAPTIEGAGSRWD